MKHMQQESLYRIMKDLEIHYDYDAGMWYVQNYKNDMVSVYYRNEDLCLQAIKAGEVEWEA